MTAKGAGLSTGAPEDRLRAPFENLMSDTAALFASNIVCAGETPLPDRLGRPDYAVLRDGALAGYVELKAPGVGADARRLRGRDREQFRRFSSVPNILYGDGNEWALYRGGERAGFVRFSGDVAADGAKAVSAEDARSFMGLLRDFLLWEPIPPLDRNGKIDLKGFAAMLAPLCRMLRDDVTDALRDDASPLAALARDWRQLLFPDATDPQFADSYAQTVAFALLLGRSEGADPLTLESAQAALAAQHSLLSRALQILTDPRARSDLAASLDLLLRVVSAVPPVAFAGATDPWLHFYEDFLADYDPKLRKDAGAYYTPVEVVRAQVRLIDDLLTSRLDKPLGFADPGVVTLDPAVGTGTYLLGVIAHALARVEAEQGGGAVAGQATALARNLYGFEFLAGPYAVSELRIGRALADRGASLPPDGAHIYLTDTLESPDAEQHAKALRVKSGVRVLVCLGNPPYDRHEAARSDNEERTGGWVRRGDGGAGENAILRDFTAPATAAGYGVHLKNLYNLYVYFWRWALWKVFENETAAGPGVVGFITASSYLDGDAFTGMREHMRRLCDEIWVLDLGGEQRGARKSENVFAIRTPVAIAVATRFGEATTDTPATVRHGRVEGTRDEKLAALDAIDGFGARRVAGLSERLASAVPPGARRQLRLLATADRPDAVATFGRPVETHVARRARRRHAEAPMAGPARDPAPGKADGVPGNARPKSDVRAFHAVRRRDAPLHRRIAPERAASAGSALCLSVVRPTMDVSGHAIERLCSPPAVARPRPEAGLSHEPAVARARRRAGGDGLRGGPRSPSFPGRKRQERRPPLPVGGRLGSKHPARSARHAGQRIRAGRSPRKTSSPMSMARSRTRPSRRASPTNSKPASCACRSPGTRRYSSKSATPARGCSASTLTANASPPTANGMSESRPEPPAARAPCPGSPTPTPKTSATTIRLASSMSATALSRRSLRRSTTSRCRARRSRPRGSAAA